MEDQRQHHRRRRRRQCVPLSPSADAGSSAMCSADEQTYPQRRNDLRNHRLQTSSRACPLILPFACVFGLLSIVCPHQFIAPVSAQTTTYGTLASGCKSFNLTTTADSTLTIKHFSAYFDTTECLRATVSTYDDFTDMWSTMCQADVRGGGGDQRYPHSRVSMRAAHSPPG